MKKPKLTARILAVRLEPELREEIERRARLDERPVASMARILLRKAVFGDDARSGGSRRKRATA